MSEFELPKMRGFSLLEVLIVIGILAFLYTLALSNVSSMQTEAKISKANGDLKSLKLAIDYYVSIKNYCPEEKEFQRIIMRETPGMLYSDLLDPFAESVSTPYGIKVSPNRENYVVFSIGVSRNGSATIDDRGNVRKIGTPIVATNGYL
jgi:prepilin-type N-terminal cleavage/methylation domain-containing protein